MIWTKNGKVYSNENHNAKLPELQTEKEKRDMIKHQIETNTKMTTSEQKDFEAFEKLSKLDKNELDKLGNALDEAINHYKYKSGDIQN